MSWNIRVVGKPADVKAHVAKDQYVPQSIKDAVAFICDAGTGPDSYPNQPAKLLEVKTSGHYDHRSNGSNIHELRVQPVELVIAQPEPLAPAAAQTNPPSA